MSLMSTTPPSSASTSASAPPPSAISMAESGSGSGSSRGTQQQTEAEIQRQQQLTHWLSSVSLLQLSTACLTPPLAPAARLGSSGALTPVQLAERFFIEHPLQFQAPIDSLFHAVLSILHYRLQQQGYYSVERLNVSWVKKELYETVANNDVLQQLVLADVQAGYESMEEFRMAMLEHKVSRAEKQALGSQEIEIQLLVQTFQLPLAVAYVCEPGPEADSQQSERVGIQYFPYRSELCPKSSIASRFNCNELMKDQPCGLLVCFGLQFDTAHTFVEKGAESKTAMTTEAAASASASLSAGTQVVKTKSYLFHIYDCLRCQNQLSTRLFHGYQSRQRVREFYSHPQVQQWVGSLELPSFDYSALIYNRRHAHAFFCGMIWMGIDSRPLSTAMSVHLESMFDAYCHDEGLKAQFDFQVEQLLLQIFVPETETSAATAACTQSETVESASGSKSKSKSKAEAAAAEERDNKRRKVDESGVSSCSSSCAALATVSADSVQLPLPLPDSSTAGASAAAQTVAAESSIPVITPPALTLPSTRVNNVSEVASDAAKQSAIPSLARLLGFNHTSVSSSVSSSPSSSSSSSSSSSVSESESFAEVDWADTPAAFRAACSGRGYGISQTALWMARHRPLLGCGATGAVFNANGIACKIAWTHLKSELDRNGQVSVDSTQSNSDDDDDDATAAELKLKVAHTIEREAVAYRHTRSLQGDCIPVLKYAGIASWRWSPKKRSQPPQPEPLTITALNSSSSDEAAESDGPADRDVVEYVSVLLMSVCGDGNLNRDLAGLGDIMMGGSYHLAGCSIMNATPRTFELAVRKACIACCALRALQRIHALGLLHGDAHPRNVRMCCEDLGAQSKAVALIQQEERQRPDLANSSIFQWRPVQALQDSDNMQTTAVVTTSSNAAVSSSNMIMNASSSVTAADDSSESLIRVYWIDFDNSTYVGFDAAGHRLCRRNSSGLLCDEFNDEYRSAARRMSAMHVCQVRDKIEQIILARD